MLVNTFHKFVLFQHIQFHVFIITATSSLTVQVVGCPRKTVLDIMTTKVPSSPDRKPRVNRNHLRSFSSPSCSRNVEFNFQERSQSQLHFAGNMWHNPQFPWSYNTGYGFTPMGHGQNHQYCSVRREEHGFKNNNTKGLLRKWESLKVVGHKKSFVFTLMSYNVLAQDLVENHAYLYQNHDPQSLPWHTRWLNILKEIGDVNPDIICFQEVQESHIDDYFGVLEKKLGYKSIFKRRTGIRTDGCAIYYKVRRLHLLDHHEVEYLQKNVPILNRDNVGIVAKFIPKENNIEPFVVATTHLLYNPRRQDVRLAQIQNLMAEIDKMAYANKDGVSYYTPVILTGDLNSTPDSAIYEFITRGVLHYEHLTKMYLTKERGKETTGKVLVPKSLQMTDNCQYADVVKEREKATKTNSKGYDGMMKFSSGTLSHAFHFKSAYKHFSSYDTEATTHQDEWKTVDYIFYSANKGRGSKVEDKLKLLAKYQLLTRKQLVGVRIPNASLGSDHFSLAVKFSLS